MRGYVASARVVRCAPRLASRGADTPIRAELGGPTAPATWAVETIAGGPDDPGRESRVAAFRERWSQLTFFLFDPNSWRT